MAIGVLAIAQGAAKVAGKIFQGVKKARDRKVEKAAGRLLETQKKQAEIDGLFRTAPIISDVNLGTVKRPGFISSLGSLIKNDTGSQVISGAGNALADLKSGPVTPRNAALVADEQAGGKGFDPKYILIGLGLLLALPFIKKLIR